MKNIIKMIGLFALIGFSFFYTDKVIEVIREEDEIMINLTSIEDIYKLEPVNATILGNTITPGLKGRTINITKSYNKMKINGIFNKNLIIYDYILPSTSIDNNKDKFIIKGNNNKQMISLIFILNNDKYFNTVNEILKTHEFYSYGDNGEYTPDNLLFSNNLLSRIRGNNAIYCLSNDMNEDVLSLCSKNDLYTITPTIIGDKSPYTMVKNNLSSGSMIMLSMNNETVNELATIIDYIKGKGFKIGTLSNLLNEDLT